MKKIKLYKNILTFIIIVVFISLSIITIDLITDNKNWKFLAIDFENKSDIVSSYGTLIGGILTFLSILFVLISLLEQRQQILDEKLEIITNEKNELLDKLKLLSSFFKSAIDNIKIQGEEFKQFYLKEKENPSQMNKMYFTTNKNFTRIIDIDPSSIYKAIKSNFKNDNEWEKMFLNIYSIFDFYAEALKDLREKYQSQINFKVEEQKKISDDLRKLLNIGANLIDEYKINIGADYLNYPWCNLVNEFTPEYYGYLKECDDNKVATDLRVVSNELLLPLLENAMIIRQNFGYDIYGSRLIVNISSDIRKRINEVEANCKYYAEDIENQYLKYFSDGNENILKIQELKTKFEKLTE